MDNWQPTSKENQEDLHPVNQSGQDVDNQQKLESYNLGIIDEDNVNRSGSIQSTSGVNINSINSSGSGDTADTLSPLATKSNFLFSPNEENEKSIINLGSSGNDTHEDELEINQAHSLEKLLIDLAEKIVNEKITLQEGKDEAVKCIIAIVDCHLRSQWAVKKAIQKSAKGICESSKNDFEEIRLLSEQMRRTVDNCSGVVYENERATRENTKLLEQNTKTIWQQWTLLISSFVLSLGSLLLFLAVLLKRKRNQRKTTEI